MAPPTPALTKGFYRQAQHGLYVGFVGYVGPDEAYMGFKSGFDGLLKCLRAGFLVVVCDHHACAFGQESHDSGVPHSAGAAGDYGDLVL